MNKKSLLLFISLFIISACSSSQTSSSSSPSEPSSSISSETSSTSESSKEESSSIESSQEQSSSEDKSSETSSEDKSSETSSEDKSSESSSEEISSSESSSQKESEEHGIKVNPMNEPMIHQQYYLNHIGDIYNTWKSYTGKGVTIAVIDVGFNPDHEDFKYKDGTSKISKKSASFTTTKDSKTKKYTTTRNDDYKSIINMGESHGTFCAGVAAAAVNGKGVIGIAPEAELLLLKTDAKPRSICAAFEYAADQGAKVVSISIGSYKNYDGDLKNDESDLTTAFDNSVKYCNDKGTVVISAGGNGGEGGVPNKCTYPGGSKGVIGIGGLKANSSDTLWEGTSYNPKNTDGTSEERKSFIDYYAPSNLMYGMCHFNRDGKYYTYDGGWNGTSFAAPIVAGMAALYFEKYPENTPVQFEQALKNSSKKLKAQTVNKVNVTANQLAGGRVDVGALLDTEAKDTINIKIQYTGSTLYAFGWDNTGTKSIDNLDWPGKKLTKTNGSYNIAVDASKYQNIIFNTGTSSTAFQTVDLLTSSFVYGNAYNLNSKTKPINLDGVYIAPYASN